MTVMAADTVADTRGQMTVSWPKFPGSAKDQVIVTKFFDNWDASSAQPSLFKLGLLFFKGLSLISFVLKLVWGHHAFSSTDLYTPGQVLRFAPVRWLSGCSQPGTYSLLWLPSPVEKREFTDGCSAFLTL